jgi:predicted RND superfamily exporter protein
VQQPPDNQNRTWGKLAQLQAAHPWRFVLVAAVVAAGSLPLVMQLGLRSYFTDLLPTHARAVTDFEELLDRFGVSANLSIAIHGDDLKEVRALTRELADSINTDPPIHVRHVDWNLSAFQSFVETNKYLYADYEDIEAIVDSVEAYVDWEKAQNNPLYFTLEDEEPEHPKDTLERIQKQAGEAESVLERFPDGFLQHPDMPLTVMFVRTTIKSGEVDKANELLAAVRQRVAEIAPRMAQRGLRVDFGGDMMNMLEEIEALQREILLATVATIVLVLLAVYIFFLSIRAIPLLGIGLLSPVLLTFAFAELSVDFLNTSTAFLGSIVIGNGINPNIMWLARYFETRREGHDIRTAIAITHRNVWTATLTASSAAGLAYASLALTDFRGFRDFGIIGGVGMFLCWAGAHMLLPAFAAIWDRIKPIEKRSTGSAGQNIYGTAFAWLALRAPRGAVIGAALVTLVSSVIVTIAILSDPMEYDYRRLMSEVDPNSRVTWVNDRQGEIVPETVTGSAIAILVPHRESAPYIREQLESQRQEWPEAYSNVVTYDLLLPARQEDKIELYKRLRKRLESIKSRLDEKTRAEIDENMPPADLVPIADSDIPIEVSRLFTEKDGTVGRVVYVEHHPNKSEWDGRYLLEWSEAVRAVSLEDGALPAVAGRPPIFADLQKSMLSDGPKAVAIALSVTILLLLVAFRKAAPRLLTLAALLGGILWMAATMAVFRIRLNFLNFVAFPITFGNGVDYGVNVTKRTMEELGRRPGDPNAAIRGAIEATGGAVILCSMTTIIGYISLYASTNQALNSFGAAMAISEITCLASAVVGIPAIMTLWSRRKQADNGSAPGSAEKSQSSQSRADEAG